MGAPCFIGVGRGSAITLAQIQSPYGILSNFIVSDANGLTTVRAAATASYMGSLLDNQGTARVTMFRKNNADTALSPSITDSTAGAYYDTSDTISLAVNDTFDYNLRGTAPAYTPWCIFFKHQTTGPTTANYYGCSNNPFNSTAGATTNYLCIANGNIATGETVIQTTMRTSGTVSFGTITVTTGATSASTGRSRKNGANGNITISIGAGLTGQFIDVSNSDTFVSGDTYNFSITAATPGTMRYNCFCFIQFGAADNELATISPATWNFSASNQFIALMAGNCALTTTESNTQMKLGVSGVLSRLRLQVGTNTMTGTSVITLRKNGANATSTVSIGTTTTGSFEDTTHTDAFTENDTLNFILTGGTSGAIGMMGGFFVLSQAVVPPAVLDIPTFKLGRVSY